MSRMEFVTLSRGPRRRLDGMTATFGKHGRIMFNSNLAAAINKKGSESCLVQRAKDNPAYVRIKLQKPNENDPNAYRLTRAAGGGHHNSAAIQAKAALDEIGYDYSSTKSYPVTWNSSKGEIDIVLPAERISLHH